MHRSLWTSRRSYHSRSIHTTSSALHPKKDHPKDNSHSADNYFKDVDSNPPPDPTIHRVDAASEAAQRPYEPPSGQWSRAGSKTEEYATMDKEHPYDIPADGNGQEKKLRYGGKEKYGEEKGSEISQPDEGPAGKASGGMGRGR
ncbi:hypothetical protein SERLADRAFT_462516 [Serpula lacrymans var. lacrymans S7.9]|nr:uncharacterized protein SERLADRAFT_462516 [Serpula lacrymans var. lacrymans S7.9]EGO28064.1 hypothetical protein SERLADRAFT_462516 [Serpula lacrymans var. lacrymans S7.9]